MVTLYLFGFHYGMNNILYTNSVLQLASVLPQAIL